MQRWMIVSGVAALWYVKVYANQFDKRVFAFLFPVDPITSSDKPLLASLSIVAGSGLLLLFNLSDETNYQTSPKYYFHVYLPCLETTGKMTNQQS